MAYFRELREGEACIPPLASDERCLLQHPSRLCLGRRFGYSTRLDSNNQPSSHNLFLSGDALTSREPELSGNIAGAGYRDDGPAEFQEFVCEVWVLL